MRKWTNRISLSGMSKTSKEKPDNWTGLRFGKTSIMLMVAGMLMVVLGFILMSGGGSDDPGVFSPEIFSTRRITLAPILVIAGFVLNLIGIMKR